MIGYEGKIIVIAGPTASGKSNLSIQLAKDIGGYIINGDSRQVYKHLSIGTAKPFPDKLLEDGTWIISDVRHFLYDIVDPKDPFTLFEYQQEVQKILDREEGIPIIVGGTGLYIDSVVFNYDLKENNHESDLSNLSLEELQERATPFLELMTESDKKNPHRLIRAIQKNSIERNKGKDLNSIYFVLDIEKEELRKRIEKRVNKMFEDGLEDENRKLLEMGYRYEDKGLNSIGYREFEKYFRKECTLEEVKKEIVTNTLRYAKRQRTWFRRNKNCVYVNSYESMLDLASNFISKE